MKYQKWTLLVWVVAFYLPMWLGCEQPARPDAAAAAEQTETPPAQADAPAAPAQEAQARGQQRGAESETLTGGLVKDLSTVDVALPMECRGQEPSWHLSLTEEAITLRRLGEPMLVFEPATFRASGGVFILFTTNKEGHNLSLMLVDEACTDPMDGTNYPYSVKMTVDGKTYGGCARPVR